MPALYSIVRSKCPRCNVGDLYEDNHPYHLKHLGKMKKSCDACGQKYEPETGFYYGAMYVSYGLSIVAMFVPAYTVYAIFNASFAVLLAMVLSIYVLTFPIMFRWSRNIWLNIFVKYDEEVKERVEKKISNV